MIYIPQYATMKNSLLYKGTQYYNQAIKEIQEINIDKFKNKIKAYTRERVHHMKMPTLLNITSNHYDLDDDQDDQDDMGDFQR